MLSREQIQTNIQALEQQGAQPGEIQAWLDSLKAQQAAPAPQLPSPQPEKDPYNPLRDIFMGGDKANGLVSGIIQNTIGSKGIVGVAQNLGKAFLGKTTAGEQERLGQTKTQLAQTANSLIAQAQKEKDPARRRKLLDIAAQSIKDTEGFGGLEGNIQNLQTSIPQIAGTAVNAGLTAATFGRSSILPTAGLKGVAKGAAILGENAALGAGFQGASNLIEGKPITEGMGTAAMIGGVIPIAGRGVGAGVNAGRKALGSLPSRAINSLIKPVAKQFSYGKDPGRGVAKYGIVANSMEELVSNIRTTLKSVGEKIGQTLKVATDKGIRMNVSRALAPLDEAIARAKENPRTNAALIRRLEATKDDLLGLMDDGNGNLIQTKNWDNLTPEEVFQKKTQIGDLTKWTGQQSDDEAVNKALKGVYGTLKDEVNKVAPGLKELTGDYADLLSAKIAGEHRDILLQRQNMMSLGVKLSSYFGVFSGVLTGNPWVIGGGLTLGAVEKMLGSTAFKTRLAKFAAKLTPAEKEVIRTQYPILERILGSGGISKKATAGVAGFGVFNSLRDATSRNIPVQPQEQPKLQSATSTTAQQIANAIKAVESGGNYGARGKSGEFGGYQFTKDTWNRLSKKHLGKVAMMSPQNQDKVALAEIQDLLNKGRSPKEIALIWNGGEPVVKRGVNKFGVKYDSGAYAQKVLSHLARN